MDSLTPTHSPGCPQIFFLYIHMITMVPLHKFLQDKSYPRSPPQLPSSLSSQFSAPVPCSPQPKPLQKYGRQRFLIHSHLGAKKFLPGMLLSSFFLHFPQLSHSANPKALFGAPTAPCTCPLSEHLSHSILSSPRLCFPSKVYAPGQWSHLPQCLVEMHVCK